MNCSRISSRVPFLGAAILALLAVAAITGCGSDQTAPKQAELTLRFVSDPGGVAQGATIWIDGAVATESLTGNELRVVLDAGDHTIVVRKDCTAVSPAETLLVTLTAGQPATREFQLRQLSGLQVSSDPAGLPVLLDGAETGQVTPASFGCLVPGTYDVRVSPSGSGQLGFHAEGDTAQTVVLGDTAETVEFQLASAPRPQTRGMLLEIFTASECPNCPPADRAADELNSEPAFSGNDFSLVHIHLYWGGTDPLFNLDMGERADFYRVNPSGAPIAYFNGKDRVEGTLYTDLKETYRSKITNTFGSVAPAGLYWTNPRVEGDLVRAGLRFVAIEDLSQWTLPALYACVVKDSVRFVDPVHDPNDLQYIQGVREYLDVIDLAWEQKTAPGSILDLDVTFDLSLDSPPSYVDWPSGALRLVAFVQDIPSHEVLQCREIALRR